MNGTSIVITACALAGLQSGLAQTNDIRLGNMKAGKILFLGNSMTAIPLAEGKPPADWRDDLLVESQIGRMVVTKRYKYSLFDRGARREMLVDLKVDPGEMKNLAASPAVRDVLADHRRRMAAHLKATGVAADVPA